MKHIVEIEERVEWTEPRDNRAPFYVIAEKIGGEWRFSEKGSWEGPRWYDVESSEALIHEAETRVSGKYLKAA